MWNCCSGEIASAALDRHERIPPRHAQQKRILRNVVSPPSRADEESAVASETADTDGWQSLEDDMLNKLFNNSDELLLIEHRLEALALDIPKKQASELHNVATELGKVERRTKQLLDVALGSTPRGCDTEAVQESRKDMLRRRATIFTRIHQLNAQVKARKSTPPAHGRQHSDEELDDKMSIYDKQASRNNGRSNHRGIEEGSWDPRRGETKLTTSKRADLEAVQEERTFESEEELSTSALPDKKIDPAWQNRRGNFTGRSKKNVMALR